MMAMTKVAENSTPIFLGRLEHVIARFSVSAILNWKRGKKQTRTESISQQNYARV